MLVELTPKEYRYVQSLRAEKATGYRVAEVSGLPPGVRAYYIWSWGLQPSGVFLRALMAGNPERAAEKFLRLFKPGTDCNRQPVPIKHWGILNKKIVEIGSPLQVGRWV